MKKKFERENQRERQSESPSRHLITEDSDEEGAPEEDFDDPESEKAGTLACEEDNWKLEQLIQQDKEDGGRLTTQRQFENIEEAKQELKELLYEHGYKHSKLRDLHEKQRQQIEDSIAFDNTRDLEERNSNTDSVHNDNMTVPKRIPNPFISNPSNSNEQKKATTPTSENRSLEQKTPPGRKRSIDSVVSEERLDSSKQRRLSITHTDEDIERIRNNTKLLITNLLVGKPENPSEVPVHHEIAVEIEESVWKEKNGWTDNYRKRMREILGYLQHSTVLCSRLVKSELTVSRFLQMSYNELADDKLKAERDEAHKEDLLDHILPPKTESVQVVMVPAARTQEIDLCEITSDGIQRLEEDAPATVRDSFDESVLPEL